MCKIFCLFWEGVVIRSLVFLLVAGAVFLFVPKAQAGKPCSGVCSCTGVEDCAFDCTVEGCSIECTGTGDCNVSCPKGKCKVTHTGTGNATLDCPGDGCSLTCTGTGDCKVTSCTKGCKVSCTGTGACSCPTGCSKKK